MIITSDLLGKGLYSPHDAALYARVTTQTMKRWIYGDKRGEAVVDPQISSESDKIVTFLDFVQALAIRRIRHERRIPLAKIREAYFRARDEFKVQYPLALDSTRIGLFGPPNDPLKQNIWICLNKDEEESQEYFQLTGNASGNKLIAEVIRTYSYRLHYDEKGLADRYCAYQVPELGEVIMDPKIRFGEPFVSSCDYTTRTLYDAYRTEGSVERAADIYGTKPEDIALAVEFYDHLKPPSAA